MNDTSFLAACGTKTKHLPSGYLIKLAQIDLEKRDKNMRRHAVSKYGNVAVADGYSRYLFFNHHVRAAKNPGHLLRLAHKAAAKFKPADFVEMSPARAIVYSDPESLLHAANNADQVTVLRG
jgi:hypothetical protein